MARWRKRKRRRKTRRVPGLVWLILLVLAGSVLVVGNQVYSQRQAMIQQRQAVAASKAKVAAAKRAFIERLAPYAETLQQQYNILPSVTLAQAILESDWGQSELASKYHNLFGVKGTAQQQTAIMSTKEFQHGKWVTVRARFRVYPSDQAAMRDHALLFVNGTSWNRRQYAAVVAAQDYHTAARALQQAGYATDPKYASKLVSVIQQYKLTQYDE